MFSSLPRSIHKHPDGGKIAIGVSIREMLLHNLTVRKVGGFL